ncbi:uncharacterized protein [Setaria viridis]|uniref:uncharacterized protein n=1 Tax=Setaria viridis TaxID=4556 RepID=UPI003B3A0FCD
MLLRSGKRLKRAPGGGHDDDDDGLPLADEMLILIFARLLDTDDLVRCAATCRRWRRLVSGEASFICRSNPEQFVPVGFFNQGEEYGVMDVPRFVPLASHFPSASVNALFADEPFRSSRLVTSRKGRLVLELCRASRLKLAVCNPMTGNVSVLPALAGRDNPGRYACALLTADDLTNAADPPGSASSFRLVIVYDRRDFTACRTYSSDAGSWSPEGIVSGARVSGRSLAQAHAAAAAAARGAVFWRVRDAVLVLRLDSTLEAALEPLPEDWTRGGRRGYGPGVLAVSPDDGRLCVVEARIHDDYYWKHEVKVRVMFREHDGGGEDDVAVPGEKWVASRGTTLQLQAPSGCYGRMTRVSLRGVCEKSGVVFLAAVFESRPNRETPYALDLGRMEARLLRGVPDVGCRLGSCASFHGYEMDRLAYVTSLGKRRGKGMITMDVDDIYDFY